MSMYWEPVFGYGMFLRVLEAEEMARKAFEIHEKEACDVSFLALNEYFDGCVIDRDEDYSMTGIQYLISGAREEPVEGAMFYGSKTGTVLQGKAETDCYKDIHEMANEFREEYGKYLPADFDYEAHMVLFWGAKWW